MKKVIKSGLGFVKEDGGIVVSPYQQGHAKRLKVDNNELLWKELKYLEAELSSYYQEQSSLLQQNGLVFDVMDTEYAIYEEYSRNVQSLACFDKNNPFEMFKQLINLKILVVGLGTVGSSLIQQMDKFGFSYIDIIDADSIELKNITAQSVYMKNDIGEYKAEVLKKNFASIKNTFIDKLSETNIDEYISLSQPDYIICCADDVTGDLQKELIQYISKYHYKLLITGYSQQSLLIHLIDDKTAKIFLDMYHQEVSLNEEKVISHNTGTIIKGAMSASLALSMMIDWETGRGSHNSLIFDLYSKKCYAKNIGYINLNEYDMQVRFRDIDREILKLELYENNQENKNKQLFDLYYYLYIKFLTNTKDKSQLYLLEYLNKKFIDLKYRDIEKDSTQELLHKQKITKLEQFKMEYFNTNGFLMVNYEKHLEDIVALNTLLGEFEKFVYSDKFNSLYEELINLRRQNLSSNLSEKLIEKYGTDFINSISKQLVIERWDNKYSELDILKMEYHKEDSISFEQALQLIDKAISSQDFTLYLHHMVNKQNIDFQIRQNKTTKNLTLFNFTNQTSKIILNFTENIEGVAILSHEMWHAYFYQVFAGNLDFESFYKIPKFFWEIFAKLGELYLYDSLDELNRFYAYSYYQLNFCLLDKLIQDSDKAEIKIDDVIKYKHLILEKQGISPEIFKYTQYNFINYRMLYSSDYYAYDSVYSDILALGLFTYIRERKLSFDDFVAKVRKISKLEVTELMNEFNLSLDDLLTKYISDLSTYLNNYFLR